MPERIDERTPGRRLWDRIKGSEVSDGSRYFDRANPAEKAAFERVGREIEGELAIAHARAAEKHLQLQSAARVERAAIFAMQVVLSDAIGQFHTILQHLEADPPEPISTGMLRGVLRGCERASLTYAGLAERGGGGELPERRALGRIEAWASHYKDEARSQQRGTMRLIYEEASAALSAPRAGEPPTPDEREAMSPTAASGPEFDAFTRGRRMGEANPERIRAELNAEIDDLARAAPNAAQRAGEPVSDEVERLTRDRDDAIRSRDTHKVWNHTAERERDAANVKVDRLREALETIEGMTDGRCDRLSRSKALDRLGDVYDLTRAALSAARATTGPSPERMTRVQQEDADGCGVAVLAMLTGQSYADVDAEWPLRLTKHWDSDVKPHMMMDYLWRRGYSLLVTRDRRYADGDWPSIRPFAPMHYARVDSPTQPTGHWIAIDGDGGVLDPFDGTRRTLDAYEKMHEVVGVWPARAALDAARPGCTCPLQGEPPSTRPVDAACPIHARIKGEQ